MTDYAEQIRNHSQQGTLDADALSGILRHALAVLDDTDANTPLEALPSIPRASARIWAHTVALSLDGLVTAILRDVWGEDV